MIVLRKKLPSPIVKSFQRARYLLKDRRSLRLADTWPKPLGYDRIYHFHVRKTGGASLNFSLLNLCGECTERNFDSLNRKGWLIHDGHACVSHNSFLLERGEYFIGWSHLAMHEIKVPDNSFTVTILRDPAARVISHYRMLRHWRANNVPHPGRALEERFLGEDFADFLKRIPRQHLLRQLYMFSKHFSVEEALAKLERVNFIMMTETYAAHLDGLGRTLEMPTTSFSRGAGYDPITLTQSEWDLLNEAVAPEYRLLELAAPLVGVYRERR